MVSQAQLGQPYSLGCVKLFPLGLPLYIIWWAPSLNLWLTSSRPVWPHSCSLLVQASLPHRLRHRFQRQLSLWENYTHLLSLSLSVSYQAMPAINCATMRWWRSSRVLCTSLTKWRAAASSTLSPTTSTERWRPASSVSGRRLTSRLPLPLFFSLIIVFWANEAFKLHVCFFCLCR